MCDPALEAAGFGVIFMDSVLQFVWSERMLAELELTSNWQSFYDIEYVATSDNLHEAGFDKNMKFVVFGHPEHLPDWPYYDLFD